ncbi:MAG: ribonuclease III [Cytophagales bacterium]|nr:ribonuclease III [Cytophagales bacterium]
MRLANMRPLSLLLKKPTADEKNLFIALYRITGKKPGNLELYKLALKHSSVLQKNQQGAIDSNERLEYLGDAILGAVIAEYLFKKFPYKEEGFLTEIRSRLVNRDALNGLAKKIGLDKLVQFDLRRKSILTHKSIYGNALEALVGAVYLDKGFHLCRRFVLERLLNPYFNLDEIIETDTNFKSKLIEWAQKVNREVRFEIVNEAGHDHRKEFTAQVLIDNKAVGTGRGFTKKKAEQVAAQEYCKELDI